MSFDDTDLNNALRKTDNSLSFENYYALYAPEFSEYVLGQYINSSGVVTQNTSKNYATVRYNIPDEAVWINFNISQIYVTNSTYSVVAFYNESGKFIYSILSTTLKRGQYNNSVSGTIPSGTSYIIVSYAGFSTLTNNVNSFIVSGRTYIEKQTIVANGRYSSDSTLQYYLSIPNTNNTTSIAVNGKIEILHSTISSCDFYYASYDADYTNRTLFRHITGVSHTDHEITLCNNAFTGTNMPSTTAAYIGIIINIGVTAPVTSSGAIAIQNMSVNPAILSNVTINNTPITNVKYPQGPIYANFGVKENVGYNPLMGARICCLGDSLTGVYYKTEEESWPFLIAKWNNAQVDNLGVSSCPLTQYNYEGTAISTRSANLSASKFYTHIFVMAGANDFNLDVPIGNNDDSTNTTFKGAINYTIDHLTSIFPCAKLVFATTYRRNINYRDKPYADAMLEVCALRSVPCLNNYENSGVRFFDEDWIVQFGATNSLGNNHLNNAGDLFVAPRFEQALKYGIL